MKILFAGNKARGISCLEVLKKKYDIVGVIGNKASSNSNYFIDKSTSFGFKVLQPEDVNDKSFISKLKEFAPDITILAGYGQIVKKDFLSISKYGCINLHGGKLPKYRGSSPMNWALINGDPSFTISIIQVDLGVDTGDILIEKEIPIGASDTINDLIDIANKSFPSLLLKVLVQIEKQSMLPKKQDIALSSYYPLRFPEDGIVFFDQLSASQIHNRVKALTFPFPGVISYYGTKKLKFFNSSMTKIPFFGEPGRIYRISKNKGILVCAKDKCLWLNNIVDYETNEEFKGKFNRYHKLATVSEVAQNFYENR